MTIHRTHLAGLLAIGLPWTFPVWPLAVVPVAGLVYLRCMTAWIAAGAAAVLYEPRLWPLGLLVIPVGWWARTVYPPGTMGDSLRSRLLSWLYLVREWSWKPRGPGSARVPLEHAHIRSDGLAVMGGPAHNEWLEFAYEWGLAGVLLLLAAVAVFVTHARTHHALSASLLAAGLVLAGSSPIRAFLGWLRGGRPFTFGPPLRCTIMIHIDQQGRAYLYVPNVKDDPDLQARVGDALLKLGQGWTNAMRNGAPWQEGVRHGDAK